VILYHGSYTEIKEIDLLKSKKGKDFGTGFYTTNVLKDAENMARRQGITHHCAGFVSGFKFDYDKAFLSGDYKTKKFEGYTEEFLDFIKINRTNFTNTTAHNYDIVEGPVADDDVNKNMPDYIDGIISSKEFLKMLEYKGSHQICFCTSKSLSTINRINLEAFRKIENTGIAVTRYLAIKDKIPEKEAQSLYYKSETFKKLSDESTLLYMKPWQEIYEMVKKEIEKPQEKPQEKQKDDDNGLSL
jgi:hypothetical protein